MNRNYTGGMNMLSRNDIEQALADGHLKIFPFDSKKLTGIGYNLSTTDFAFSINQGILLTLHEKTTENGIMRYVIIPPNDTVLFFSQEYIEVDNTIAGTFHSKVSCVSQGLGHISTTLDPTWKGQLLLSVNNPTSRSIVFNLEKSGGNIVTMLLHKLDSEVTGSNIHDNNKGRCELLITHFAKPSFHFKLKKKHLELKDFVQKELADSLNGYDNFLNEKYPPDKYSLQVEQLKGLRQRLDKDRAIISEGRYQLGEQGLYHILKDEKEVNLIKQCVLTKYIPELFQYLQEGAINQAVVTSPHFARPSDSLHMLSTLIKVIDYQLAMIDHARRIQWQNMKVKQFAGEDSELVRVRRILDKGKWISRIIVLGLVVIVCLWLLIYGIIQPDAFSEKPFLEKILLSFGGAAFAFLLTALSRKLDKKG